jgi:hypothetical protein
MFQIQIIVKRKLFIFIESFFLSFSKIFIKNFQFNFLLEKD